MNRDKFKVGDRVLAGLYWGVIVGMSEWSDDSVLVLLDTNCIRSFHWAECYHEKDVTVME